MTTNLTLRQQTLVDLLADKTFHTVADVGCDHGYIGATLLHKQIAKQLLFIDVSAPSLEKAKTLCQKANLSNCQFLVQDGLEKVFCDCAIIAGMGGKEIISILSNAENLPNTLVLQPMKNTPNVRQYLCQNYHVDRDFTIFEGGKYYDVLLCTKGQDTLSMLQQQFGKTNLCNPSAEFVQFIQHQIDKYEKIVQNTTDENTRQHLDQLKLCKKEIENAKNI